MARERSTIVTEPVSGILSLSSISQLAQAGICTSKAKMNMFKWGKSAGGRIGGTSSPPGNPLELITYDTQTGKFALGAEALAVLRKVKGPVGVVAVSGRARQGKSYILNQLLGQSSGFMVASTHRPCTKGLWMWSTPVERQGPDGSKYHLVCCLLSRLDREQVLREET